MKKSTALKQLLRAPLKTALTFLLIAAASFALFSRVIDSAVTTRERENIKDYYKGVAALDNTVPDIVIDMGDYSIGYDGERKPWPSDEQLERFFSLPGVTLAETRYMTAGRIEGCRRFEDGGEYTGPTFIIEGEYAGYDEELSSETHVYLEFDHAKLLAGDMKWNSEQPFGVYCPAEENYMSQKNPYPKAYWDNLEKGSRCLVVGTYDNISGYTVCMEYAMQVHELKDMFCVTEGLGDDYLETEEFAFYKETIEAVNQALEVYDVVYTSDMRSIPYVNERSMVVTEGRPLTMADSDGCVVSDVFLEKNQMSVGDVIQIQLGDRLYYQNGVRGAKPRDRDYISDFTDTVELKIIGAYHFTKTYTERLMDGSWWTYAPSTVFVPASLLPVSVPEDYEGEVGQYSVFIEDAEDIEGFLRAAEPLVTEMGINMRFSDGGWMNVKEGLQTGVLISFLTTALYVAGTVLALLLAAYLYVGRNKKSYAVMRMLGVPGRTAASSVTLPFLVLSVSAMSIGGAIGFYYTRGKAAALLEKMMDSAPDGYVLDAGIPISVVSFCFLAELGFTVCFTWYFLRSMKKIPPLELLCEKQVRAAAKWKAKPDREPSAPVMAEANIAALPVGEIRSARKKYGALRQVPAYIMRHMRRGAAKTAVSLILAAVLAAGIGSFVMASLTFQDIFEHIEVKGGATGFSTAAVRELSRSDLARDFYYQTSFYVMAGESETGAKMVFTNDMERYLSNIAEDYTFEFAEGYDASSIGEDRPLCILGKQVAEMYGVRPGDHIELLSDSMYYGLENIEMYAENEAELKKARKNAMQSYTVIGVVDSSEEEIVSSMFGAANYVAELMYSGAFAVEHSAFILTDNTRLDEMNDLLEETRAQDYGFGLTSSYYIDAEEMKTVERICRMLKELFPIALGASVLIGMFGPGLIIMQSAKEAAYLRVLGVTKKRARCMLVLEQIVLCLAATLFVAAILAAYHPGRFLKGAEMFAFCGGLYVLGSVFGAVTSSVLVTRHKVLELLHSKE